MDNIENVIVMLKALVKALEVKSGEEAQVQLLTKQATAWKEAAKDLQEQRDNFQEALQDANNKLEDLADVLRTIRDAVENADTDTHMPVSDDQVLDAATDLGPITPEPVAETV